MKILPLQFRLEIFELKVPDELFMQSLKSALDAVNNAGPFKAENCYIYKIGDKNFSFYRKYYRRKYLFSKRTPIIVGRLNDGRISLYVRSRIADIVVGLFFVYPLLISVIVLGVLNHQIFTVVMATFLLLQKYLGTFKVFKAMSEEYVGIIEKIL